ASALNERTVQRALASLETAGFLESVLSRGGRWSNGRGRTSTYQLIYLGTNPGAVPGFAEILGRVNGRTPVLVPATVAETTPTVAETTATPAETTSNPG